MTAHIAILRFAVHDRPVCGILASVEAIATGDGEPVGIHRTTTRTKGAWSTPRVVVLETAADNVGATHVGGNLIELAGLHGVLVVPGVAAIMADVETAIMTNGDDARVFRIDPERVIVGVGAGEALPGLAAIERHLAGGAADEELLVVDGVDTNLAEVGGALVLIAAEGPGCAAIIRPEHAAAIRIGRRRRRAATATAASCGGSRLRSARGQPAGGAGRLIRDKTTAATNRRGSAFRRGAAAGTRARAGFHLGVNCGGSGGENGEGDTAIDAVFRLRPARAFQLGPGIAAIGRFPHRAARSAAVIAKPGTTPLERRGIDDLSVGRVNGDIVEPRVGVDVLRLGPGLAAVLRAIQSALGILPEEVAHGCDEDDLRVSGIHRDAVNRLRVIQTEVSPGLAAVCGAANTVANRGTLAVVGFAHPDVDDIGVRRRNGNRANGFVRHIVELRLPVIAAVCRLPKAAGGKADIEKHRVFGGSLNIIEAARHDRRANGAELKAAQKRVCGFVGFGGGGARGHLRPNQAAYREQTGDSRDPVGSAGEKRSDKRHFLCKLLTPGSTAW